jgi:protein phosphatase
MSEVKYKIAAGTNVGLVRQNNEDNFVVCPDLVTSQWLIPQADDFADLGELGALLVVADGMGGANAGEVASAIAVDTIQELFRPEKLKDVIADDKTIQEFMKDTVKQADMNILNKSKEDESTKGMGTTIVMAWILGKRAYVCWCGDSRCYLFNPKTKNVKRLSKDHSYVQELVDRGELRPEEASSHPYSNVITRCLGNAENRANPDTRIFELHNNDCIMLCSDGLSGLCEDLEIADIMTQFADKPAECKDEMISAALNAGGHDNVTVAMCRLKFEGEEEEQNPEEEEQEEADTHIELGSDTIKVNGKKSSKAKVFLWILAICAILAACAYYYLTRITPQ